jgi:hypothetical protein
MEQAIREYFRSEQLHSLAFIGVGLAALVAAIIVAKKVRPSGTFFAVPVALLAAAQLATGITVLLRTEAQVEGLLALLERDAMAFTLTELQRMEGVIDRFVLYRRLAKGLLIGGFILAALGARRRRRLLALGSGLALQGGLTLVLDTLARSRALDYYRALGLHRFSLSGLLE